MADYHYPTVVQPNIPAADMTPLERLILDLVFDSEIENDSVYYHSWCGASDIVTLSAVDLHAAHVASRSYGDSSISKHVEALLARYDAEAGGDPHDDIDVDLSGDDSGWHRTFQDIVRRSSAIEGIIVTTSFTCTKMLPDGFGGSVMLITVDDIRYRSTFDVLEEFWNEADKAAAVRLPPSSEETP